jgi:hypothetical protein
MATTNLFTHPVFKDGALTANDREVRRYALRKTLRNIDLAAEIGAKTYVVWGGREGSESGAAKDVRLALDRYKEGIDTLCEYVREQGYDLRFALEPSRTSPAATSCCRRSVTRSRSSTASSTGHGRVSTPRSATSRCRTSTSRTAIAQALWSGKLFHIDLNGQNGPKFDQDLRFGAGDLRSAFWLVDLLESSDYSGPLHFDFKPPRTEDYDGVWASAAGCMRNYLILKERALAFRADPEVQEALRTSKLHELAEPTLDKGESLTSYGPRPTTSRRWPPVAARSSSWTSWPWTTCSAPADRRRSPAPTRRGTYLRPRSASSTSATARCTASSRAPSRSYACTAASTTCGGTASRSSVRAVARPRFDASEAAADRVGGEPREHRGVRAQTS